MIKEYRSQQAAEFLGVSIRTLATYRKSGALPFIEVPNGIGRNAASYLESDLLALLKPVRGAK